MKTPPLTIVVKYDHASGRYRVTTDRGAAFNLQSSRDTEPLGNTLYTYMRECLADHTAAKRAEPTPEPSFSYSYDESQVRAFDRLGNPVLPALEFDELELDL